MSQVTQPRIPLTPPLRTSRAVWIAALVALVIGAGLVLALTLGSGSDSTSTGAGRFRVVRAAGPSESAVAASVGNRTVVGPSESSVAASIRSTPYQASSGPDESRVAAAIAGR